MKPFILICLVLAVAMHRMPLHHGDAHVSGDPDALFAQRDSLALAQRAEAIWAQRLAGNANDFESAWKLARVRFWLGGHAPEDVRRKYLDAGVTSARLAAAIEPARPEGHFWLAANMGGLAESFGFARALRYRGPVKDALEMVLRLDPAFQQGSADRALGRWYQKVPRAFGGSKEKAEEHMRRSLQYAPQSTASLFFLAETLLDLKRPSEARVVFQAVVDAPFATEWIPEDREFKEGARRMLQELDTCPRSCICRSTHGPGAMCVYSR